MNPWIYTIVYTSAAVVLLYKACVLFVARSDQPLDARFGVTLAAFFFVALDANVWLEMAVFQGSIRTPWYFVVIDLTAVHVLFLAATALVIALDGVDGHIDVAIQRQRLRQALKIFAVYASLATLFWVIMLATMNEQSSQRLFERFGRASRAEFSPIGWMLSQAQVSKVVALSVWSAAAILLYGGAAVVALVLSGKNTGQAPSRQVSHLWTQSFLGMSVAMMAYGLLGPIGSLPPVVRVVFLWPIGWWVTGLIRDSAKKGSATGSTE